MQCVILVGGLGTRLGTMTANCPKPLLSVNGRPFIEYLLDNAARFGVTKILLLAGYKASAVRQLFSQWGYRAQEREVQIIVLEEPSPLGTAGALRFAAPHLESEFLMLNGDSFFDFNWLDLSYRPWQSGETVRMALCNTENAERFGLVSVAKDGTVIEMQARPSVPTSGFINGGVYWMRRCVLDAIPEGGPVSLEQNIFPALIQSRQVTAKIYDEFFIDIGVPASFAQAQNMFPLWRPAVFYDRDGVLNKDFGYVHSPAQWEWIDSAIPTIKALNDAGKFVFVVTNQAGVGHGYYTENEIKVLHAWIQKELAAYGAHIDAFRYCPHHPEAVIETYRKKCSCRKPAPGMIFDLLQGWPVLLKESILIGDKPSDIEAGKAAGLDSFLFQKHLSPTQ